MYGHTTLNYKVDDWWLSVPWFEAYKLLYTTITAQLDICIPEMDSFVQYCWVQ